MKSESIREGTTKEQPFKAGDLVRQRCDIAGYDYAEVVHAHPNGALDLIDLYTGSPWGGSAHMMEIAP